MKQTAHNPFERLIGVNPAELADRAEEIKAPDLFGDTKDIDQVISMAKNAIEACRENPGFTAPAIQAVSDRVLTLAQRATALSADEVTQRLKGIESAPIRVRSTYWSNPLGPDNVPSCRQRSHVPLSPQEAAELFQGGYFGLTDWRNFFGIEIDKTDVPAIPFGVWSGRADKTLFLSPGNMTVLNAVKMIQNYRGDNRINVKMVSIPQEEPTLHTAEARGWFYSPAPIGQYDLTKVPSDGRPWLMNYAEQTDLLRRWTHLGNGMTTPTTLQVFLQHALYHIKTGHWLTDRPMGLFCRETSEMDPNLRYVVWIDPIKQEINIQMSFDNYPYPAVGRAFTMLPRDKNGKVHQIYTE